MVSTFPLQFGIPGGPELLVILLIAVLLFGANKIPKLARSTGEAMGEFQKGREEVEQELEEMRDGAMEVDSESETVEEGPEVETADDAEASDAVGDSEGDGDAGTDDEATDEEATDDEELGIADAETDEEAN